MKVEVEVNDLRELVKVAGIKPSHVAKQLKLSESMAIMKIKGRRAIFMDEVPKFVKALNSGKRVTVDADFVIAVAGGSSSFKLRGYAK